MTEACTLIIFGATGNLAQLKLLPALYHLETAGLLPDNLRILCSGRSHHSQETWIDYVRATLSEHARDPMSDPHCNSFCSRMHYFEGNPAIADPQPETAAAALNRDVERCVRAFPEHYQWTYRRFEIPGRKAESPYRRR